MDSVSSESLPKKRSRSKMRSHTEEHDEETPKYEKKSENSSYISGDGWNIALLLFLYLLQGIPLGLSGAIPIILQNRHVSYSDQAEFSFVIWPFSIKLLWAPIVDAVYSAKFGRRKSWLIPTQLLIGFFMLVTSMNVDSWLGDEEGTRAPNIRLLTLMFFLNNFLAATQDIAVDGWALTMLNRKNVGHASTCNTVGQTAGYFFGYVVFIALDSADFCNKYLFWLRPEPKPTGLISFASFMYFWGIVYVIATILVALFKKETCLNLIETEKHVEISTKQSYKLLWEILRLKPVQYMAAILLTVKIGFAACDSVGPLKLIENGVPKEKLAMIAIPLIPLQIIIPFVISRYIVGPRPMDCFLAVIPYRLLIGVTVAVLVYVTPRFKMGDDFPLMYYVLLVLIYGFHQMIVYCMFVAHMAFFAKVSDPRAGGTYMTLLNTLSNLGGTWPSTLMLWFVDTLTFKSCRSEVDCIKQPCHETVVCETIIDGFYIEMIICTVIGIIWLLWGRPKLDRLQNLGDSAWMVNNKFFSGKT